MECSELGIATKDTSFHIAVLLAVCFYPLGVPLFGTLMMMRNHKDIQQLESITRSAYVVFAADYKPRYYYWEMAELMRKMILTGLVSVVAPGSLLQISVAVLFSAASLIQSAWHQPFMVHQSNKGKAIAETALLFILVASILNKANLADESLAVRMLITEYLGKFMSSALLFPFGFAVVTTIMALAVAYQNRTLGFKGNSLGDTCHVRFSS